MDNLSQEEVYLKRPLVYFFDGLDYKDNFVPFDAATKKQGKRNIETHFLVDEQG